MAYTDSEDLNYRGELFAVGAYQTPFLSMIGGLGGGKRSSSFLFPVAQTYGLTAASQPAITETVSADASSASVTTVVRTQDTNTAQIFKEDVAVTFMKQSQYGAMSGINTDASNPVTSELTFQKNAALKQMAIDMEYTFLNGEYITAADSTTAAKSRGIITAAVSNTEAAGDVALSTTLMNQLLVEMATNGAVFDNCVIFVNGFQKQALSALYGYAPADRNVGGLNIASIETDFAKMGVVYDPHVPAGTLLIADMAHVAPVFVPVGFNGEELSSNLAGSDVLWVPTAITAAKAGGFFYSQAGLDYGPEEYHGTLTGLKTS